MRQIIATRLAESIGPIPTFYLTTEIEMDNAVALRKAVNASVSEAEKISLNDIVVKASAMALVKHPFVNASYQDTNIRFYEQADIGVAVAIDEGLITPVIRGANLKGFLEIAAEIKDLAAKAKAKKLQPEEYTGATFSISNLGMFGIKEFTAIINPPEAGILEQQVDQGLAQWRRRHGRQIPPNLQANARKPGNDVGVVIKTRYV